MRSLFKGAAYPITTIAMQVGTLLTLSSNHFMRCIRKVASVASSCTYHSYHASLLSCNICQMLCMLFLQNAVVFYSYGVGCRWLASKDSTRSSTKEPLKLWQVYAAGMHAACHPMQVHQVGRMGSHDAGFPEDLSYQSSTACSIPGNRTQASAFTCCVQWPIRLSVSHRKVTCPLILHFRMGLPINQGSKGSKLFPLAHQHQIQIGHGREHGRKLIARYCNLTVAGSWHILWQPSTV